MGDRERREGKKKVQHNQKVIGRKCTTVLIVSSTWGQNSKSVIISPFEDFPPPKLNRKKQNKTKKMPENFEKL